MYEGCGVDRRCLGSNESCIENRDCIALVTVRPSRGRYEFEMFSLDPTSRYVAVGLSKDNIMVRNEEEYSFIETRLIRTVKS